MTKTTQMAAARQGIVTKEMLQVLADEPIREDDLLAKVAAGTIAIPANRNHTSLRAKGVGAGLDHQDQRQPRRVRGLLQHRSGDGQGPHGAWN